MKNKKGFTLMELLIVIAIIAILAAALIVGINPARHFRQARHSTRWQHMESISTAIYTYAIEHGGSYPEPDLRDPSGEACIGPAGGEPVTIEVVYNDETGAVTEGTWCYGLVEAGFIVPEYLRVPPIDPQEGEFYEIQFEDASKTAIRITSTAPETWNLDADGNKISPEIYLVK
jgi:prepilin-type N-terminal cleavage/methylation domain-containing protein